MVRSATRNSGFSDHRRLQQSPQPIGEGLSERDACSICLTCRGGDYHLFVPVRSSDAEAVVQLDLHFLVDEVYALQVFPTSLVPHPEPFVSVLSFDFQTLGVDPSRVHVLAGPTKDFGASGMKVGALISQHNPAVVEFIEDTARANPMSSASDALFTQILEDDVFREWFLDENRKRLSRAFERAAGWCTFHKLPCVFIL